MRQRVGFARALVVHPNILLMDEPFSALDVLTAETLRTDFLDLWGEGKLPIKGVILVTHNIEEAVLMCDRILLFSTNPGRIIREIRVDLRQPRNRLDPQFRDLVEKIYVAMTARTPTPPQAARSPKRRRSTHRHGAAARLGQSAVRPHRNAGRAALQRQGRPAGPRRRAAHGGRRAVSRSPRRCRCCASPRSKAATSSSPMPASSSPKRAWTIARSCSSASS